MIRLAEAHADWVLGFQDEVWFSRLAQPALHAWTAGEPLRLGLHPVDRADPEPKALACYGLWLPARERMLLRFVNGRPISPVTCAFLAWAAEQLAAEGVRSRDAASTLKRHPFYVEKVFAQAANFSEDELRDAVVRLAELDYGLKGGSKLAPDLELQRALIDLTAAD